MSNYRYKLDRSSKKFICPGCGKKRFVRYHDGNNGTYLPEIFGCCDRSDNCGYHVNPYKERYQTAVPVNNQKVTNFKKIFQRQTDKVYFIPNGILEHTMGGYEQNNFIQYLLKQAPFPFSDDLVKSVIDLYDLGTIKKGYMKSAITFPFKDINSKTRTIQCKKFDKSNRTTATGFVHALYLAELKKMGRPIPQWINDYMANEIKVSCLFGEHLLKHYPQNPIALVEAPKTAIYGTLYFGLPANKDDFLWLAVYNKSSLTLEKCKVLEGRNVVLFPDLSTKGDTFKLWVERAKDFEAKIPNTTFIVSDLLENLGNNSDREEGKDIADYLIQMNWRDFRKKINSKPESIPHLIMQTSSKQPDEEPSQEIHSENSESKGDMWDIAEIESFFASRTLPDGPLEINQGARIENIKQFIHSHISVIKRNNGKPSFIPYYDRLIKLRTMLVKLPIG